MIDSHQHFWKYSEQEYSWINNEMQVIKRSFLPEDLWPLLSDKNIEGCIAVQARQSEKENTFLLNLAKNNDFIFGVVGWIDLLKDNVENDLIQYKNENKLKGFRHVIQDEPDPEFMLNPVFITSIKKIQAEGYVYDILIYEQQIKATVKFLENFSNEIFILDHIAKPNIKNGLSNNWKEGISNLAKYPNLYCKISGMVTETNWNAWNKEDFYPYIDHIISCFGTERVMFGSDWPVCLLSADNYGAVFNLIKEYCEQFSEEERRKIFRDNAMSAYGIVL